MKDKKLLLGVFVLLGLFATALFGLAESDGKKKVALDYLPRVTGVAMQANDPSHLYLASRQGLFLTTADKQAQLLARNGDNLSAFAAAPNSTNALYASGFSSTEEPLGFLRSNDGGRTWVRISNGADGEVSFHALAISQSDPKIIYGVSKGLQVSHDGGKTWSKVGGELPGLYSLAVSSMDSKRLYAATRGGLMVSQDGGENWIDAYQFQLPVTLIRVTEKGVLYAYILGKGLMRSTESTRDWVLVNNEFGSQVLLQMITAPNDPDQHMVLSNFGRVLVSQDGGKSWHRFSGDLLPSNAAEKRGEKLYVQNCQTCHGLQGVGETFTPEILRQAKYFFAPPLNDLSHAWHHTDDALVETILEGVERTDRMRAWKDKLSKQDAQDVVAYMKSQWGPRALECQGPKHMQCM